MEHVISMEEFHSRKVEIKEAGESSRDNDQPVIVAGTSSKDEKFKKLKDAQAKVQLGTTPKIREVLMLRDHKHYRKYCEPRLISLGPIHHGKPAYQLTEEYKLMLAEKFIGKTGRTVEELYGIIEDNIKELREYYDEKVTQKYSDKDLARMLFYDGCTTLQFIDLVAREKVKDFKIKIDQVAFVQQDFFLLENQLPYKLLNYLMKNIIEEENLRESIQKFINMQSMLDEGTESSNAQKASHLLDILRKGLPGTTGKEEHSTEGDKSGEKLHSTTVNTVPNKEDKKPPFDENAIHLLDLLRKRLLAPINKSGKDKSGKKRPCCFGNDRKGQNSMKIWHLFPNVQELREVGIHLKPSPSSCLGEIQFTKKWNFYPGILQLPRITVDQSTGLKFFNLIAYEMCPDFENDFGITSYISFLDSLIDEPKDVIDLRKAGTLRNLLGSNEEVALVFNEIGTDLVPNPDIYKKVRLQIQEYFDKKSMTWIPQAAFFVIGLTVVQTVYSVLAYYKE
ncbi:hypothetical protein ACB098_09G149400 [Castanea mollissima]